MEDSCRCEHSKLKYDRDVNAVILDIDKDCPGEEFRLITMHAAEMVRQNEGACLIADVSETSEISDADRTWIKKTYISYLKKNPPCGIVFVEGEKSKFPFELFENIKNVKLVKTQEDALKYAAKIRGNIPSEGILDMTVEDAKEYMGLAADANDFAVDEKFWQLSKRYEAEGDEQKLTDLSAVYNIATGRRDAAEAAAKAYAAEKKYFGKTKDDWKNFFSYNWLKMVIIAIVAIAAGNLIYSVFFADRYDCYVVSVGNFEVDGEVVERILEEYGYSKPYVNAATVVVPNDEDKYETAYADQTASTLLTLGPNVIITDEATYPYYFSYYEDLSEFYAELKEELPAKILDKITPVYMSEKQAYDASYEYLEANEMTEEAYDPTGYDMTKILIGFEITDEALVDKLGYDNNWDRQDATLVFSINSQIYETDVSEDVLKSILLKLG